MDHVRYLVPDSDLSTAEFLSLAQRVWPGRYDTAYVQLALAKTINITARSGPSLIGCVRLLTDGYFFTTVPELLVEPDFRRRGIGSELMRLAWEASPTSIFFGAQPGKEAFYERLGFERGLQSYGKRKPRPGPSLDPIG